MNLGISPIFLIIGSTVVPKRFTKKSDNNTYSEENSWLNGRLIYVSASAIRWATPKSAISRMIQFGADRFQSIIMCWRRNVPLEEVTSRIGHW